MDIAVIRCASMHVNYAAQRYLQYFTSIIPTCQMHLLLQYWTNTRFDTNLSLLFHRHFEHARDNAKVDVQKSMCNRWTWSIKMFIEFDWQKRVENNVLIIKTEEQPLFFAWYISKCYGVWNKVCKQKCIQYLHKK